MGQPHRRARVTRPDASVRQLDREHGYWHDHADEWRRLQRTEGFGDRGPTVRGYRRHNTVERLDRQAGQQFRLCVGTCHLRIPLGFTYTGFGGNTSVVSVSSHGVLFQGNGCSVAFRNSPLPTSVITDAALFFFWADLNDFGSGEFMEYATLGSPGGRAFNLYFRSRLFASGCGTSPLNVMVSVHEGSRMRKASYCGIAGCDELRGSSTTLRKQTSGGRSAKAFTFGVNSRVLDDNANRQTMSFHPPN